MADKNRPLYILRYLLDHTDEDHPAIIKEILAFLEEQCIHSNRKTMANDLAELQDSGFDVVCYKSRQNKYFIGNRGLELSELKTIVDAVQAAKFISPARGKLWSNVYIQAIISIYRRYRKSSISNRR